MIRFRLAERPVWFDCTVHICNSAAGLDWITNGDCQIQCENCIAAKWLANRMKTPDCSRITARCERLSIAKPQPKTGKGAPSLLTLAVSDFNGLVQTWPLYCSQAPALLQLPQRCNFKIHYRFVLQFRNPDLGADKASALSKKLFFELSKLRKFAKGVRLGDDTDIVRHIPWTATWASCIYKTGPPGSPLQYWPTPWWVAAFKVLSVLLTELLILTMIIWQRIWVQYRLEIAWSVQIGGSCVSSICALRSWEVTMHNTGESLRVCVFTAYFRCFHSIKGCVFLLGLDQVVNCGSLATRVA